MNKEVPIPLTDYLSSPFKLAKATAMMLDISKLCFSRVMRWMGEQLITTTPFQDIPVEEKQPGRRILMVVSEAPPIKSGVGKVISELQKGLEEKGHRVDILSSVDIPRYSFGEIRLSTLVFHWWRLRRSLEQYDLINIHAPAPTFADLFLLLVSRFGLIRRQKIVLTYHCEIDLPGPVLQPLTRWYSYWHKRLAKFVAHTIVTTPSYAEMFSSIVPEEQVSVIPWGVSDRRLNSDPVKKNAAQFELAFVGQLRPYKGLDVLLHAMTGLPTVNLTVVGAGHHAASYQQLATDLELNNVRFLGAVSDEELQRVMKQAHVLVLPSRTKAEAFGIVLIEAMAAGCVPVASDLPGVCDVVSHAGFTFPVGDSDELMKLLHHLSENPALVQRQAAIAQMQARYYTWQRCVDAHELLFEKMIAAQSRQPTTQSFEPLPNRRGEMMRIPASS